MKIDVPINFRDGKYYVPIDTPSTCPHCGRTVAPQHVGQSSSSENSAIVERGRFSVIFRCAYEDCQKYFVIEYINNGYELASTINYFYRPKIKVNLPENIEKISPDFVKIYTQSAIAEKELWDQIAGVGYRKAAEFLIKDYAISKKPADEEKIKSIMLGQVISTYLNDFPKILVLAKSVAWIGNDETHYIRRHDGKDIEDLKRFILATARLISADYDADEALLFTSSSD